LPAPPPPPVLTYAVDITSAVVVGILIVGLSTAEPRVMKGCRPV
jgi:hypothetical protein